ncbi:MAG3090 family protein [Mycoplasma sp. 613B]
MKRLLCQYNRDFDKKFSKTYPWVLKHPKLKQGLALFKTRKEAMNWFLAIGYESAIWFQTEKRIFGGLLIMDKTLDGFEFELNTEKFDGDIKYDEAMEEFYIFTNSRLRNQELADQFLKEIADYKVLADHKKYFPANDDYIPERKVSSKDREIERLNRQMTDLEELFKSSNGSYAKEIAVLMEKLRDSNSDKETLRKEIENLKKKILESIDKEPEKVIVEKEKPVFVEKEVVKEVVKEVPVYIEKEVVKEVVKEVPVYIEKEVVNEVVKEVYINENKKEPTKYSNFYNLESSKQLEALAIYSHKLEKIASSYDETMITSTQDYNEIKKELDLVTNALDSLDQTFKDDYSQKLLLLVKKATKESSDKLLEKIKISEELFYSDENAIYYKKNKLSHELSFINYENKHIGFVEEKNYKYGVIENYSLNKSHFLVFQNNVVQKVEKFDQNSALKSGWTRRAVWTTIIYWIAYIILLVVVIILAVQR